MALTSLAVLYKVTAACRAVRTMQSGRVRKYRKQDDVQSSNVTV